MMPFAPRLPDIPSQEDLTLAKYRRLSPTKLVRELNCLRNSIRLAEQVLEEQRAFLQGSGNSMD